MSTLFCKTFVRKPWGYYVDHARADDFVVKTMVIDPGKCLSVQKHKMRYEDWTVVKGRAVFSCGDTPEEIESFNYGPGDQINVIPNEWHTVLNPSATEPLVITEVQRAIEGGYCYENDIERHEEGQEVSL